MSVQLEITNPRPTVRSCYPSSDLLVLFSEVLLLLFVGLKDLSVDSYRVAPAKRIYITAPDTNFYVNRILACVVQNTVLIDVSIFFFLTFRSKKETGR